jgi:hypothetical protein
LVAGANPGSKLEKARLGGAVLAKKTFEKDK